MTEARGWYPVNCARCTRRDGMVVTHKRHPSGAQDIREVTLPEGWSGPARLPAHVSTYSVRVWCANCASADRHRSEAFERAMGLLDDEFDDEGFELEADAEANDPKDTFVAEQGTSERQD